MQTKNRVGSGLWFFSALDHRHASIRRWLEEGGPRALRSAERFLRSPRWAPHRDAMVLPAGWLGDALLTLVREGRTREAAVERMVVPSPTLALSLWLMRLNDPYIGLRERAFNEVCRRFAVLPLDIVLRTLPLWDGRMRFAHSRADDLWPLLLSRPNLDAALVARTRVERLPLVLMSLLVLRHRRGLPLSVDEVVHLFAHPDRGLRMAIARTVASTASGDVLALMLADASADVRLAGLKRLAVLDVGALEQHRLDVRANNRFWVRERLQRAGRAFDLRELALQHLGGSNTIGALGLLAEAGRSEDIERVRAFRQHHRASVRKEASRTLRILMAQSVTV